MKGGDVVIRKAKKGDEVGIAENFNEGLKKGVFNYTGSNKKRTKKDLEKWKDSFNKETSIIFVAEINNKIVGSVFFLAKEKGRTRHRLSGGWSVHPDYQRRGIGTLLLKTAVKEAKKRGFKRLEAEVAVKNISSWKISKKAGFKIEGIKKKGLLLDNKKYADTYMLGRIL